MDDIDELRCNKCMEIFSNQMKLKYHLCFGFSNYENQSVTFDNNCEDAVKNEDELEIVEEITPSTSNESERKPKTPIFNKECKFCHENFNSKENFVDHSMVYHAKELLFDPFECKTCGKLFLLRSELINHMNNHSNEQNNENEIENFECMKCHKKFESKLSLSMHMKLHIDIIQCKICGLFFLNDFFLNEHLKIHEKTTDENSLDADLIKTFVMEKNNVKNQCLLCKKVLSSKISLKYHIKNQVCSFSDLKCRKCGKNFKFSRYLARHKCNYKECKFCTEIFKTTTKLHIHLRLSHPYEFYAQHFKCKICKKMFIDESTLNNHLIQHRKLYVHKCKICEKVYNSKAYLKEHLGIHSANKKFKCTQCEYSTSFRSVISKHLKMHRKRDEKVKIKEKLLKCEKCDRLFYIRNSLILHLSNDH